MKPAPLLCLSLLLLSACNAMPTFGAKEPKMISGNAEGMSYSYDGSYEQLNMVTQRAMVDCQKFGRFAIMKNTGQIEDSHIANFNCMVGCQ